MDERPATYREVFAVREYVHLFFANVLSILGDQLAKVALSFLVFDRTQSEALAAAAFASSYIPWLIGGPLLSAYADRLPRRYVLISCDLVRAGLVVLMVLPGMPSGVLIGLLFTANIFSPPFISARAALMPEIMAGDKYVVANGLDNITYQVGQIIGFAVGGAMLTVLTAQGALAVDAATFVVSALLIAVGVRHRPAAVQSERRPTMRELLGDTWSGAGYVFGNRTLRTYLLLFWLASMFAYAVEGLVVPLTEQLDGSKADSGLILAAAPLGLTLGSFVVGRLIPPGTRIRMLLPLALFSCAILIPIWLAPPLPVLLALLFTMGFCTSFSVPLNPMFGRAVADEYRGRAFGVAISGLYVTQGLGIFAAGLIAQGGLAPTTVAALSGVIGTLVVLAFVPSWPHPTFGLRTSSTRAGAEKSSEAAA